MSSEKEQLARQKVIQKKQQQAEPGSQKDSGGGVALNAGDMQALQGMVGNTAVGQLGQVQRAPQNGAMLENASNTAFESILGRGETVQRAEDTGVIQRQSDPHSQGCSCPTCSGTVQRTENTGEVRRQSDSHGQGCSCPTCSGTIQRTPVAETTIQRKLDQDKYSPQAMAQANLDAGFKLLGKTTFSQLKTALGQYFLAQNPTEEYTALNKVLEKATQYQQSNTRTKKHKGKQKAREESKQSFVQDLIRDAEIESANLKTNLDTSLLQHLVTNDAETAMMAVANRIAPALGYSLNQLKDASPEAIKTRFIERVYLDYSTKRSANQDTGENGQIIEILNNSLDQSLLNPIKADQLPDNSEAKELFEKITASNIHNPIAYRAGKATKFMEGGSASEAFQPTVDSWSDSNEIKITGNNDFRGKIKALINVIKKVPVGQALLQELGSEPNVDNSMVHPQVKKTVLDISPPALSAASRFDQDSQQWMYAASAGSEKVAIDPDNPFVGNDLSKGDAEKWRIRDAAIGLFHEMIHAYLHKIGGEEFDPDGSGERTLKIGSQGSLAEVRITGVPYEEEHEGKTYNYAFDDPKYNYISENTFRREFADSKGLDEVFLRPSYGNQPGQKPLGLDAVPVK